MKKQVWNPVKYSVSSENGVVTSQSLDASRVGAEILHRGGNAVDAAIAISFALGVAEPWMSGIGGGGYMVVRSPNECGCKVIEFGMRSPLGIDVGDYPLTDGTASDLFPWKAVSEDRNVHGASSVAIPGQVAGMDLAHREFGTMTWAELVDPSVQLAANGLEVDWFTQLVLSGSAKDLARYPGSRKAFFNDHGFPLSSAWTALSTTRCNLSDLSVTLDVIAREGARSFYEGELANAIVDDLQEAGGKHEVRDFASYQASIVDSSSTRYRGHTVYGAPEYTSGPTLTRVLELLQQWYPSVGSPDVEAYIAYHDSMRTANLERLAAMGDNKDPGDGCTTHFNVIDREGRMVAVTQTLLSIFGSRMVLPRTGFLMNNGIMWFDPEQGKPNSLGPDRQCLSNMCPTILEHEDGSLFALGAAGGRKIMPAVAQLCSFLADYNMSLDQAISTPRIDVSFIDTTVIDSDLPHAIHAGLQGLDSVNTRVSSRGVYPYHFACPSIAGLRNGVSSGVTEIMAPRAAAVAV